MKEPKQSGQPDENKPSKETATGEQLPASVTPSATSSRQVPSPPIALPSIPTSDGGVLQMPIAQLRPHPLNAQIYGDGPDEAFIANVHEHGILQPLLVTWDWRIISGHNRYLAAKICGLTTVPVVVSSLKDESEIEKALIDANLDNRERTNEVKIREGRELHRIEKERAAQRKRAGKLVENLPQGNQKGASRDFAAKSVGMSGKTLEHGVAVVEKIDALKAAGKTEDAETLRQLLNHSIDGAFKKVEPPKRQKPAAPPAKQATDRKAVEKAEAETTALDATPAFTGAHNSVVLKLDKDLSDFSLNESPLQSLLTPDALVVIEIGEQSLDNCIGTFGLWGCDVRAVITVLEQKEEYEEPTACPVLLVMTPMQSPRDIEVENVAVRLAHGEDPSDAAIAWMKEQGCASVHITQLSELVNSTDPEKTSRTGSLKG